MMAKTNKPEKNLETAVEIARDIVKDGKALIKNIASVTKWDFVKIVKDESTGQSQDL